jgi:hypothetical protein
MKIDDLIRSLEIFRRYFDEDDDDRFLVDYDMRIMIDNTDRPLSKEDYKELKRLEWYQTDNRTSRKLDEYDFMLDWFRSPYSN